MPYMTLQVQRGLIVERGCFIERSVAGQGFCWGEYNVSARQPDAAGVCGTSQGPHAKSKEAG